jgi:hypothetical protein
MCRLRWPPLGLDQLSPAFERAGFLPGLTILGAILDRMSGPATIPAFLTHNGRERGEAA